MSVDAFKIEQHGVDAVPKSERTKSWWDLFVIQAGVNITLSSLLLGGLLVPGLSWTQACVALVVGNIILGVLLALMGYFGVDYGVSTTVASRFALGHPRGSWIASIIILISMVGWFAVTAELAGQATHDALHGMPGVSNVAVVIALIGALNCLPPIFGFENIKWLSRLAVPGLTGLCVWILYVIVSKYGYRNLVHYTPTHALSLTTGLDMVMGALIVGVFTAPDISRYVVSERDNWIGSMLGAFPPSLFLGVVGALSKLATGDWNAVSVVQRLGLGAPALIVIIASSWTANNSNLYSSGLALANIFPTLSRWQSTALMGALGTILAALRVTRYFGSFLLVLSRLFSPLIGILLCDYFLVRRSRLNLPEAYRERGACFYTAGVNMAAVVALVLGFLVAQFTPASIMASLLSLFAAAAVYPLMLKILYRKAGSKKAAGEVPELLPQANLAETPPQQP
ncbi:MAG: cytosine permease [Candidatus Sulfotelmatobacter sp.]